MSNRTLYAYERFSTPDQLKGDSHRRQEGKAATYAKQHGLVLDTEFALQDHGVSAFRGRNFEKGALGQFLQAADDGRVPQGSLLGAENLDRITRENPWDAQFLMREIFRRGISLVTFDDQRIYNEETLRNDFTANIMLTVTSHRAHSESKLKAERLRSSWVGKRARVGDKILTARVPGWIRVTPNRRFKVIPERAAVVRRVFELAADGVGLETIARTFNEEKVPTFGKARYWHRSYLLKIIESPAPIGTFTPHTVDYVRDKFKIGKSKRVRRPTEPIENYFPAVVGRDLYDRVRSMRERRAPATRTGTIRNVIAGLGVCWRCGGSVTRVAKGNRARPYLVCARAKSGAGCQYQAVPYEPIEKAIKQAVRADVLRPRKFDPSYDETVQELEQVEQQIKSVMSLILSSKQPPISLREKLDELENRRSELELDVDSPGPEVMSAAYERLFNLKKWNSTEVNALLRQIFSEVIVKPDALNFRWRGVADSSSLVPVPR